MLSEDNNKNNDYYIFYIEIQPLSDNYIKEVLEIAGLERR
jgi:hypothetical protein